MKAGEQVLLPAVREAPKHALVITDGFSCRSQIKHGTDREALHLAQVVQMALQESGQPTGAGEYPERQGRFAADTPVRAGAAGG